MANLYHFYVWAPKAIEFGEIIQNKKFKKIQKIQLGATAPIPLSGI